MIQLKVPFNSVMDDNLEYEFNNGGDDWLVDDWLDFIRSLQYVKDAFCNSVHLYTLITFESEAYRNWFVLRWS